MRFIWLDLPEKKSGEKGSQSPGKNYISSLLVKKTRATTSLSKFSTVFQPQFSAVFSALEFGTKINLQNIPQTTPPKDAVFSRWPALRVGYLFHPTFLFQGKTVWRSEILCARPAKLYLSCL